MHFTRMGSYDAEHEVPVIVRGEGCYVYDEHGKRYLDGLSALYCVNIGHGRTELGEAAAKQAGELGFYTNWSYAHPRAIELATRIAKLAPGELNRVFFTSGGSEAVESAWKLAKAYHAARGEPTRHKLISRQLAYHGTSMGALTATGVPALRAPFEPLTPGGNHVANTNSYRWSEDRDPLWAADAIEEAILFEGPQTVAAVILEPVQNSGGCFVPQDGYFQRVREICDRHGVLLISDEVICAWGRLGYWFGCERFEYEPDMITMAKGLTSAYAPLGAVLAADRIAEPFLHGTETFTHGFTFGGHPMACAVGLANIDVMEREELCGHVRANEGRFRKLLDGLRDLPIVGDVRGAGYFQAIELVKDRETKETFTHDESEQLLRGFLSGELYDRGLICRTDDRGDPVVQLSPPLIAGEEQFEEIESILRPVLSEASERIERWSSLSRA
jgi:adenosylmethionine-8-amino-7-oxononanoate aminotransferase